MNIVEAAGWYFPDSVGGTEVYVAALARRFRAAGHDVTVTAPEPGATSLRVYEHDGIRVLRYPIPNQITRDEAQELQPARGTASFHEWLLDTRPDVFHAHTFVSGLGRFELAAARSAGATVIATTHSSALGYLCGRGTLMYRGQHVCAGHVSPEICAPCVLESRGVPLVAGRVMSALPAAISYAFAQVPGPIGTATGMANLIRRNLDAQRQMFDVVDRFVVLTAWARQIVLQNGAPPEKVVVNRLGHDFRDVAPRLRPVADAPVRIGYVGRFDPIKGVLDLARAAANLPPSAAIEVEFCGPQQDRSAVAVRTQIELIAGRDPRIRIAPAVPHGEVASLLRRFDVICCPAVCLEGGPTVALEAHALRVPVIGTRIGGLAEIVRDGVDGALVEPGDWRGLAECLSMLATQPERIARWSAAIGTVRTMDEVAGDYLQLFEELSDSPLRQVMAQP